MKLEPCRWDISACELQFLFPRACVFDCLSIVVNSSQRKSFPIFFTGDLFSFFPRVSKRFQFSSFFANSQVPHIADDLKQSLPWRKIPGGIIKKKPLQKGSRRLCLIMDCSTGERILIYIFKKLRSEKNTLDGTIDIVWRRLLFQKCVDQFSYLGPRLQISFYSETIR